MVKNLGANEHLAVPTKDQSEVHDGPYAASCPLCADTVQRALSRPLVVGGVPVLLGSRIRPLRQSVGPQHPEWGTVEELDWNARTGETWIFCFEYGNVPLLQLQDIAEVQEPEHALPLNRERLAVALAALDSQDNDPPLGTDADVDLFLEAYAKPLVKDKT